jgi:hypothetical protein
MKIYRRNEFLELPDGTIYSKGGFTSMDFNNLYVKAQTLPSNDWVYLNLCDIDSDDFDDFVKKYDNMIENKASYPMNDSYARDGCFNDNDHFLVFEKEDLFKLIDIINSSISEME